MIVSCVAVVGLTSSASAQQQADVAQALAEPANAPVDIATNSFYNPSWKGSMMFNENQLDTIYTTLSGANQELEVQIADTPVVVTDPFNSGQNVSRITSYAPAFHLQSILYQSMDDWTLWMNGKRNRSGMKRHDNLTILSVDKDRAVFIWKDPHLDDMLPFWNEQLLPSEGNTLLKLDPVTEDNYEWTHVSEDGRIYLDSNNWAVRFELRANESFVSHTLDISEGMQEGKNVSFTPGKRNGLNRRHSAEVTRPARRRNAPPPRAVVQQNQQASGGAINRMFDNIGTP